MTDDYTLEFTCGNCGNDFEEQIEQGNIVETPSLTRDRTVVREERVGGTNEYIRSIECPRCGTSAKLRRKR